MFQVAVGKSVLSAQFKRNPRESVDQTVGQGFKTFFSLAGAPHAADADGEDTNDCILTDCTRSRIAFTWIITETRVRVLHE